jgi:hypothetical protein
MYIHHICKYGERGMTKNIGIDREEECEKESTRERSRWREIELDSYACEREKERVSNKSRYR